MLKFLDKNYKSLEKDKKLTEEEKSESIKLLNIKVFAFFNRTADVNRSNTTAPFTSINYKQKARSEKSAIDKNISFIHYKNILKEISALCTEFNVSIQSITGMQNGLGIPNQERRIVLLSLLLKGETLR